MVHTSETRQSRDLTALTTSPSSAPVGQAIRRDPSATVPNFAGSAVDCGVVRDGTPREAPTPRGGQPTGTKRCIQWPTAMIRLGEKRLFPLRARQNHRIFFALESRCAFSLWRWLRAPVAFLMQRAASFRGTTSARTTKRRRRKRRNAASKSTHQAASSKAG